MTAQGGTDRFSRIVELYHSQQLSFPGIDWQPIISGKIHPSPPVVIAPHFPIFEASPVAARLWANLLEPRRLFVKKLFVAVIMASLCSLSVATLSADDNRKQAQDLQSKKNASQVAVQSPQATDVCSFNFSSGADNTFVSYCVTVNGNVLQVVTPAGHQQIFGREGYGICDINANKEYFDYADTGDSPNWNSPVVLSTSATKVKIARTTSDGIWTLTQTIMKVATTSSIKVTMTLKNNTAVSREVQLSRFADIDENGFTHNTIDATLNSAMIYNSVGRGDPFGLALQNIGTSPFTYLGFVRNTAAPLAPCTPFTNQAIGPLVDIDGTAIMTYVITIPPQASKTINVGYKGM